MSPRSKSSSRGEILEGAPLHYAPANEQGVVFLFAHLSRKLRMRVEEIQQGFPDCIAYEKTSGGERRVRIEFELRSSAFRAHRHPTRGCDAIVCWEHDWPEVPQHLRVIELRHFFGLGFKVWMQPCLARMAFALEEDSGSWAVRKSAHPGDLMIMYRCAPEKCIREMFELKSAPRRGRANPIWKDGTVLAGRTKVVCRLDSPVFLEDLRQHRQLRTAGFVRANLQGNQDVTAWWPALHEMITKRNPGVRKALQRFGPERLDGVL